MKFRLIVYDQLFYCIKNHHCQILQFISPFVQYLNRNLLPLCFMGSLFSLLWFFYSNYPHNPIILSSTNQDFCIMSPLIDHKCPFFFGS